MCSYRRMADDGMLWKNLAGGGIGATVLGSLFLLYRCLQKRGLKTKSGCISFEISTPHDIPQKEDHFHIEIPPSRTPVPSLQIDSTVNVLNNPEVIGVKENVAS